MVNMFKTLINTTVAIDNGLYFGLNYSILGIVSRIKKSEEMNKLSFGLNPEISAMRYGKVVIEFYCNGCYDAFVFVSIT